MAKENDGDKRGLQPPTCGAGPLLERDYWAVIQDCDLTPAALASELAGRFAEFAPPSLVRFERNGGSGGSRELQVGDELDVRIAGAGRHGVRVIHRNANSITVATLRGHPEAGRITFGAYRNHRGGVVFHIRSRARAGSRLRYFGFLLAGDPMQTNSWTDFINRVAATAGSGVAGAIHVEKRTVREEPGDARMDRPTYVAEGE